MPGPTDNASNIATTATVALSYSGNSSSRGNCCCCRYALNILASNQLVFMRFIARPGQTQSVSPLCPSLHLSFSLCCGAKSSAVSATNWRRDSDNYNDDDDNIDHKAGEWRRRRRQLAAGNQQLFELMRHTFSNERAAKYRELNSQAIQRIYAHIYVYSNDFQMPAKCVRNFCGFQRLTNQFGVGFGSGYGSGSDSEFGFGLGLRFGGLFVCTECNTCRLLLLFLLSVCCCRCWFVLAEGQEYPLADT